ncbi:MSMEG_0565 family glycosyltransferase [filamentous cyanobacterium CCP2]|nr:MSMEG_0565 family glycosyltransferase [filamentous cyanobacterium CCP2]
MADRFKIALFTYSTKPRGSVIHTLELAEALHHLGHQVCVYALDKDESGFHRSLSCNSEFIPSYPVSGDIDTLIQQRIQEFVNYLSSNPQKLASYDYLHSQDCISANALLMLRDRQQIPHFIRTVHHIEAYNSPFLKECQDRSIRHPDLCLCVSQYWQTELKRQYQIDAPRVINGVNLDRFSPLPSQQDASLKQQFHLTGKPLYLTVGGIEPRKNSIALLHAFSQVLKHYPEAQLIIAGGATLFDYQAYRDEFFAQVEASGIQVGKSLILPGVVTDEQLSVLYRLADAFVFPSVKEGWGLVVLEAIASGTPVITANQPPFTEFLASQHALLIDPASPKAIAHAMIDVVQPAVAASLLEYSRSLCNTYTWNASAKLHLHHYRTLYARNSVSS